ncbi:mannose-1-phosphate guanylyltransferase [Saxibacter everestensis]|uniref:Mannose-1-phosphate guanylyltransferase n=1 Tax=Saxibacter everestensis TaxID=2909229 RepID=A0ABY8QR25_9MICO|nr:mannose-1-phosphate guanylyltransferase [Brevibacteriaceae bacterium ZFBP1038]
MSANDSVASWRQPPGLKDFYAIIPAGGAGTRLWPKSRQASPKFLHDLLGTGRSLLQATWDRILPLAPADRIMVVTGAAHAQAVRSQLPELLDTRLVEEPSPKDSGAAIGLGALLLYRNNPDAIVGSFSADHSITNPYGFRDVVQQAIDAAQNGDIVTVGITPTNPATGYGYIQVGELLGTPGAPFARRASAFVEKPDAATARQYMYSGTYRWNAGMFIARADALLGHLKANQPELYAGLETIADAAGSDDYDSVLAEVWPTLPRIAIDYAVAEPAAAAGAVAVVPGDFGWDDVGDFASISKLRQPVPGEGDAVTVVGDDAAVVSVDATGVVVSDQKRLVALVGVEDVVVVDTEDALLVTTRARAQSVKDIVERVKAMGREDLL